MTTTLSRIRPHAIAVVVAAAAWLVPAVPASAGEIIGGVYVHDVKTPFDKSGQEHGIDLHLGWRGNRIEALSVIGRPTPYVFAAINTAGDTNFVAAGIDWKIGREVYLRPGIGLAVHDGPTRRGATPDRIWFGSRVLFAPQLAAGVQISQRATIEASWVHFSHAQLFGRQNPGTDSFGIRLNYRY